ncbi:MAG: hypothetical protein WBH14_04495 [Albidovulum sp.]
MMQRKVPTLATSVVLVSIAFALSPLMTRDFAGYRPEQFPVFQEFWPVQPAGWAFSIWGVIYVWLILGAVWGLLKAPHDVGWHNMRRPLVISLGMGTFWIAAANASPILATVMIFAMAVFAIAAMLGAGSDAPGWQVRPVALYAGWLTAATGVGTGVVLGGYGVLSAQLAALAMIIAVLVAGVAVQSRRPTEWAYPGAIIWALVGVISANLPARNWSVIVLSAFGIVVLASVYVLRNRR